MKKHYGKCALCGRECDLTFEHIPPHAAFNSTSAHLIAGEEIFLDKTRTGKDRMPWDTTGLKYQNLQQGFGQYSLCETCNNNTGAWYGDAYHEFAHLAHAIIRKSAYDRFEGVGFRSVYPLRIIKQILSMFCSINDPNIVSLDPIRQFVLDRKAIGIDKTKYKLCMYFNVGNLIKYMGLSVYFKCYATKSIVLSEIVTYPFGFLLYLDPTNEWDYHGIDITACADVSYDTKANVEMPCQIEEVNGILPEDFRTKEEIQNCIAENRKYMEEHTENTLE